MSETSCIRINLSAVEHNVRVIRDIVGPGCALCPIIKADAYGLGAGPVGRHLKAAGADLVAVYTTRQAAELARSAVAGPILVMGPVRDMDRLDEAYRLLVRGDLHLTVHDAAHLDELVRIAERFATILPLHVEVDTGMSRGGCPPAEAPAIVRRIAEHRWLRLAGLSTHFARAANDSRFTARQLADFDAVLGKCDAVPEDCLLHVANTCATLRHTRFHRGMVRFGQGWAGYGLESLVGGQHRRPAARLRPVVSWRSRIVHVKTIPRGAKVGYGSAWTARRRSVIGLVPVGYADGLPMTIGATDDEPRPPTVGVEPGGRAERRFARVVGKVNMDQITVDLTEIAAASGPDAVGPGTAVELIGTDTKSPNHLPTIARAAGTLPHELLCRLNPRIKRLYHATERYDKEAPRRGARRAASTTRS